LQLTPINARQTNAGVDKGKEKVSEDETCTADNGSLDLPNQLPLATLLEMLTCQPQDEVQDEVHDEVHVVPDKNTQNLGQNSLTAFFPPARIASDEGASGQRQCELF